MARKTTRDDAINQAANVAPVDAVLSQPLKTHASRDPPPRLVGNKTWNFSK
jgi:hypothetical protein